MSMKFIEIIIVSKEWSVSWALALFPAPNARDITEAPPNPIACPKVVIDIIKGNETEIAAIPRVPTACPIKIVSATL